MRVEERERRQIAEQEAQECAALVFKAYVQTLAMVPSLCYLGRTLLAEDDNYMEVVANLHKSRKVWSCLLRILGSEGLYQRKSV